MALAAVIGFGGCGLLAYFEFPVLLSICSPAYANMQHAKSDEAWGTGYYAGISAGQRIGEVSAGEIATYAAEFTRGRGDGPAALYSMRQGYVSGYRQGMRQSRS